MQGERKVIFIQPENCEVSLDSCYLCYEKANSFFYKTYPELSGINESVFDSIDLKLSPDFAPVVDNHMLIFPKDHFISLASCPESFSDQVSSMCNLVEKRFYDCSCFIFEHGMGKYENQEMSVSYGNSISHAHLHILPIKNDSGKLVLNDVLEEIVENTDLEPKKIIFNRGCEDIIPTLKAITNGRPYLFIKEGNIGYVLVEMNRNTIPSQFLRKVCTEILGDGQDFWDWKRMDENQRKFWLSKIKKTYELWSS